MASRDARSIPTTGRTTRASFENVWRVHSSAIVAALTYWATLLLR